MAIVAVNSRTWTPDRMREAISAATDAKNPIEMIVKNGDYFTTHTIDYTEGEKYPWNEYLGVQVLVEGRNPAVEGDSHDPS